MSLKILHFANIESTHLYALNLVESKAIAEYETSNDNIVCVVTSENQSGGIGRCNRKWLSVSGNLFASIVTKNSSADDLGQLSLAVGCAVRESILDVAKNLEDKLKLHWPNDIYYMDKKLSGILICQCSEYLIISIGINTNVSPQGFVSIKEITGKEIKNKSVVSVLCKQLKKWIKILDDYGFSYIRSYWMKNVCYIGCDIKVRNGKETISGVFSDIDENGRAVLFVNGRCFFVSSGDLFRNQERIIVR